MICFKCATIGADEATIVLLSLLVKIVFRLWLLLYFRYLYLGYIAKGGLLMLVYSKLTHNVCYYFWPLDSTTSVICVLQCVAVVRLSFSDV